MTIQDHPPFKITVTRPRRREDSSSSSQDDSGECIASGAPISTGLTQVLMAAVWASSRNLGPTFYSTTSLKVGEGRSSAVLERSLVGVCCLPLVAFGELGGYLDEIGGRGRGKKKL